MVGKGDSLDYLRGYLSASDADPATLNIVKTCSTGWKNLPQELVDEILTYLKDDFLSLVSCSGSCKALFCSARPLIHRTLYLSSGTSTDRVRSSPRNRAQFDNIRLAERSQVLQYTTRLVIRLGGDFTPENLRPHLQYFRAMRGITSLQIDLLNAASFLPVFDECFGHIVPTLRSLTVIGGVGPIGDLFHFIPRFPLLQDLGLGDFSIPGPNPRRRFTPPAITIPPPLNGTLKSLATYPSISFARSIMNIPGGVHFRSIEVENVRKVPLQTILDACSKTLESITFRNGFPHPNLRNCTVLNVLRITMPHETITYEALKVYLSQILSTITSTSFSTFIVRLSGLSARSLGWTQPSSGASVDLVTQGADAGMVFRVEPIDPSARLLPTNPARLFRLEPCRWDAEVTDPRTRCGRTLR